MKTKRISYNAKLKAEAILREKKGKNVIESNWISRAWINQPSKLQPLHELNGTNVLYDAANERIYFLSGDTFSMEVMPQWVSNGWLEKKA
jgi:hypothetical protein